MPVKRQQKTEHPHIVRVQGVCGGQPIIEGSRLSVQHIAQMYKAGDTVDEILQAHPHVKAAAVYDALSYYLDHQAEIEREIADNRFQTTSQIWPENRRTGICIFHHGRTGHVILESNPHLFVALYTDEDITADLAPALRPRGYIAQSTAETGNAEISDEAQLIYAAEQGMAILTYNTRHFISLARVVCLQTRACWHYRLRTVQPEAVR